MFENVPEGGRGILVGVKLPCDPELVVDPMEVDFLFSSVDLGLSLELWVLGEKEAVLLLVIPERPRALGSSMDCVET